MSKDNIFTVKGNSDYLKDPKFIQDVTDKIIEYIKQTGKCETNRIIMKFKISYNLCMDIFKDLEERGIISGPNGKEPRKVLIN